MRRQEIRPPRGLGSWWEGLPSVARSCPACLSLCGSRLLAVLFAAEVRCPSYVPPAMAADPHFPKGSQQAAAATLLSGTSIWRYRGSLLVHEPTAGRRACIHALPGAKEKKNEKKWRRAWPWRAGTFQRAVRGWKTQVQYKMVFVSEIREVNRDGVKRTPLEQTGGIV